MTQFEAFKGLYNGTYALVLGGGSIVYLADSVDKVFVVEQQGRIIEEGYLTLIQAKQFTEAATGAREVTRTTVDPVSFTGRADA